MSEEKKPIKVVTPEQLRNAFGNIARISVQHSDIMHSSVNLAVFYAEHCCAVFAMHMQLPPSELIEQIIGDSIVKAVEAVYKTTPIFEKSRQTPQPKAIVTLDK